MRLRSRMKGGQINLVEEISRQSNIVVVICLVLGSFSQVHDENLEKRQ